MVEVSEIRGDLVQVTQSTRIVMRCLSTGRDSQEISQKALTLLGDTLDLLYRIKEQISWAEEKWHVDPSRLAALAEMLSWLNSTMKSIELYFQPGGVSVTYFRKRLLERTFLPRLEQYKILLLLAMQPDSEDRSSLEEEIRYTLRLARGVDCGPTVDLQFEEDALGLTSQICSEQFIVLADLCNRRLKGSCRWFFDHTEYRRWLLGAFKTLYCAGPPGAGKTFLSSAIIDSLQRTFTSPDVATVFVVVQPEHAKDHNSTEILRSILAQLVYRKRSLSYATSSLYYSESLTKGRASPKEYHNAIRAEVNRFSKVLFIIDGLDVLSDKERILSRLQKLPEHAQLLVTLREVTQVGNASYVSVLGSSDDIQTYATSRIENDPGLRALFREAADPRLYEEAIYTIVEKCHGVFLLAYIHLDLLSCYTDRNLLERALVHLPESLIEAYSEAMKQVVSLNPSAARYVYWTLYAFRPLTVSELKCATNSSTKEEECKNPTFEHSLQVQTGGLLTVDAVTGTVRFVHKTAKEYLTGTKDIAEVCITAISPDEVVDDSGFLSYAATYWGCHARQVADDEQTIQVLTKTFLNKLLWRRPPGKLGLGKYPGDWTALHVLAFFGIIPRSNRHILQGADVDANDNSLKFTPLHCAAYHRGADCNAVARDGSTALHLATQYGHRKVLKIANEKGATGLQVAVGTESDETTIPLLVKNRVGVNIRNIHTGDTVLHLAVEWRRPRIILFLLDKGAAIDMMNENGFTPLQLAAKIDNCEAISLLLQRCAQVETRSLHWVAFDLLGESLLHEQARKSSSTAVAAKLLDQGANMEARNSQGYTPLQCAARAGNRAMWLFLLDRGAKMNVETPKGETFLHITPPINNECLDIIKLALEFGHDVKAVSSQGWTPLHQVVYVGTGAPDLSSDKTSEYIRILLACGADINARAGLGSAETPLHLATMATVPRPSLIRLLVDLGAEINAKTADGKTALHLAAERGRESVFRVLLESGADVSLETPDGSRSDDVGENEDGTGNTALDVARKNPFGVHWFDDSGQLRPEPGKSRRDSVGTDIEDLNPDCSEDDTGGSTLVGSEQPYVTIE
ncbi:NACHT and ankyrin domain protein [Aspergillus sclerotiicarbonarius CBS 121057]|uniref:NACHT and ankyrin domain protein n=1 Tax=Aspergillus sclerotiicarbonarius (strain CBS 121057 / IBT 28362) TaxID=1448318 RepID=A0A319EVF6_ASPSB|nr:NACHT and ankyrin domain protein [Aspergillus sclerotiicarbonarius CBS 121057]